MDVISKDAWDLAYVESQSFDNDLGIEGESTGAKLEAWIMFLFKNQDAGGKMRSGPL